MTSPGALNAVSIKAAGARPARCFRRCRRKTVTLADGRQINGADYLFHPAVAKISGDWRYRALRGRQVLAQGVMWMLSMNAGASMEEKANARDAHPSKPRRWRGKLPSVG